MALAQTTLPPGSPSHDATARVAPAARDLLRLAGSRWAIWPLACVRSAGFPAAIVLKLSSPVSAALAAAALQSRTPDALSALRSTFAAERLRIRGALRDLAADARFREAVAWQNRRALRHSVAPLASAPVDELDSRMRKRELLVASYAQRYCVKNDTIGFFGPVAWARFSARPIAVEVQCGPRLLADRQVYFETWCIDAIARALDGRPELRPWRVPRLNAFARLDGTRVVIASRIVAELSPDEARLLAACDGDRDAASIAAELQATRPAAFGSAEAVYDLLERWHRAGYLTWSFEGPRELHPERTLRARLEQVSDGVVRERALVDFHTIGAAREALRRASGDAGAVDGALEALESPFSRLTGIAPTRADGQMYAARTLVYEECRRDVSVELGAGVLRRLGPPLSLVLHAARWAVHELARRHAMEFRRIFDQLSGGGRRAVTLGAFVRRTPLVGNSPGTLSPVAVGVRRELEERWAEALRAPAAAREIRFRSRDVRAAVASTFATSGDPPSAWARHISPDVLIDAPSVDAIRRGEYQIVLGEIHVINTLTQSVFMTQCPDVHEVVERLGRDCPEPRVLWLAPKDAAPQRVQYALKPDDFVYVMSRDPSPVPAARTLPIADLLIENDREGLVVRTRDGTRRFPIAEFLGYLILRKDVNVFSVQASAPHRPRIAIDDVVIAREQWQVPASELAFASRGDEVDRFVECQRWAHRRGIPQYAFVTIPTERKPMYLDLASPLFVDLFSRSVRLLQASDRSAPVTITEMLPTPAGAWLPDADGHRYTSELRIVAVDPAVWNASQSSAAPP